MLASPTLQTFIYEAYFNKTYIFMVLQTNYWSYVFQTLTFSPKYHVVRLYKQHVMSTITS
jgi:hypothetical protein